MVEIPWDSPTGGVKVVYCPVAVCYKILCKVL